MFKSIISTATIAAVTLSLGTLVASVNGQSSPVKYKITDLGILEGYDSISVCSINNSGVILGHAAKWDDKSEFDPHVPFLYQDGKFQTFDVIPEYQILTDEGGSINDVGQIVDTACQLSEDADELISIHAFLRQADGQLLDINPEWSVDTEARSINNKGQIAGTKFGGDNNTGFFFSDGAFQDLNISLPGNRNDIEVSGINDNAQIIGTAFARNDISTKAHAFLYSTDGQITDLGASFKDSTEAIAINNKGEVIFNTESGDAYVYRNGQLQQLTALGGETPTSATAINDNGEIVGVSDWTDGFINKNGESFSLLSAIEQGEWVQLEPSAINNNGLIAGKGYTRVGNILATHAFLLTPIVEKSK